MAYDIDRDRIVLFGGAIFVPVGPKGYPTEVPGQDTWEFDGSIWMQIAGHGTGSTFGTWHVLRLSPEAYRSARRRW